MGKRQYLGLVVWGLLGMMACQANATDSNNPATMAWGKKTQTVTLGDEKRARPSF